MQTMQPVMLYGQYEWDRERLPLQEFEERLVHVHRIMRAHGWQALIVHGDARENGLLCYLTNFIPYLRWGLALISPERPIRLIAAVGPRDLPSVQRLTHVEDVRASSDPAVPIAEWLADLPQISSGGIAVANWCHARAEVGRKIDGACDRFGGAQNADGAFRQILKADRPRELDLIRHSYAILQSAIAEVESARNNRLSLKLALIAGERAARLSGAQDVRFLSDAGATGRLRPLESAADGLGSELWSVYLAVRYCGYWSQAMTMLAERIPVVATAARAALADALAGVSVGATVADIAEVVGRRMVDYQPHPVLRDSACRAIGLSLDREPWLNHESVERIASDGAYVFVAGARDGAGVVVMETATIILQKSSIELVWPARQLTG